MATVPEKTRPKKLGNFEILQEIGQGGMGVVYLARQPTLERLIVLKKIRRELLFDASMIERFRREARAAAAVHHQNVVAVHDCFEFRGDHYIAQEFVDGPDLHAILLHVGPLDPRITALIGLEVVRGLEEIHARGIVHRDLKPANILISNQGETKIADFGIAHGGKWEGLTRPGTLVGSVPYMSPEQMLGKQVDYRSDLFSFGIMLYEMIVGEPPFLENSDDSTETLLERIEDERYDKRVRGAPRYLARLIRACLRAKPTRRIQTAMRARRELEKRLGGVSPADCRRRIALYFQSCDVFQVSENRTVIRSAPAETKRNRIKKYGWLVPAAAAAAMVAFGMIGGQGEGAGDAVRKPERRVVTAPPTPAVVPAVATSGPARLRFAAVPWAEIRLQDGTRFYTPRAAPIEIESGRHTIVFEHPRFGTAEIVVDLEPGENRLIHHVFNGAPRP